MSTPEARLAAGQTDEPSGDTGPRPAPGVAAGPDGEGSRGPGWESPPEETWELPEYEAVVRDLADKLRRVGALNEGLEAAAASLQLARADLRAARGRLDTIAGELDVVAGETRVATGELARLNPDQIRQRLDEVERAMTAGLAGLAPLLTAAHDEAARATAAGRQAADVAADAGRQATAAAAEADQRAAAAAGEAGRQTTLRIDAAEARLGERIELVADQLATNLGDLLTDRFAGVGQALAAQDARTQQGLVALQQGVAEQVQIGREATERGMAALHERALASPTAEAVGEGFAGLQGRLETVGQKVDATGAVADRAALTAQAAEQATRDLMANVEAAVTRAGDRTRAALGGRLVWLLVLQLLTLGLVAGLAYLVFQGR